MKKVLCFTLLLCWPAALPAQQTTPWGLVQPTPHNCSIWGNAFIERDAPLPVGSWVGTFNTAGVCCGAGQVVENDGRFYLTAFGADGDIAGFTENEPMIFRYFHAGFGEEYPLIAAAGPDTTIWRQNATRHTDLRGCVRVGLLIGHILGYESELTNFCPAADQDGDEAITILDIVWTMDRK